MRHQPSNPLHIPHLAGAGTDARFRTELLSMTRLIVLCLTLAFSAEFPLRDLPPPHLLATYVGADSAYAIPLAVLVGAPMYLDGYAALPLVRGMLDLGMSPGTALAFLVSGGAVSIWGVLAVMPVLRARRWRFLFPWRYWGRWLSVMRSTGLGHCFREIRRHQINFGEAALQIAASSRRACVALSDLRSLNSQR